MASEGEGVLTVPIAIFTFAIVCFTVFIVKWLNRNTSENKKDPIKHKELLQSSSQQKNDHKQKKKNVVAHKSHGSTPVNKFDHAHLITTLKGHTGPLTGGDFSPSGKHFITASQVSQNSSELKIEENIIFNQSNAYEDEWISRSDVTPSDTEDSVTSSSSGGSKMTRRQRKNKKRKKRPVEMTEPQDSSDSQNIEDLNQESCPLSNFDKFSPKFYVQQIGKSLRSLHKFLLPMCVGVQDRILSGYPFETQKGIYIYKAFPHSKVEQALSNQTLVSEETKDMKFQTESDEEISMNFLRNQTNSECGYSVGYTPNYVNSIKDKNVKRCIRCKSLFELYYNGYSSNSMCTYHSKKSEISSMDGMLHFLCCGATMNSPTRGCEQYHCHVYHHLNSELNGPLSGYKSTRPLNRESLIHSLDCEMVFTDKGFEVGRATLISLEGKSLFDEYIRPEGRVYDYNTMFSGLTQECMVGAITFAEAQSRLLKLISSFDILIGHSLEGDLAVLQIVHRRVIDSSLMYQATNSDPIFRSGSPMPRRQGLKFLVHKHFGEVIQNHEMGHNSYEDAIAALNLVLLRVMEETIKREGTSN